jgi:lysophospholipase L1-like esterase
MVQKMLQYFFYTALAMLVSVCACKKGMRSPAPANPDQDYYHYSFLALGDSYTIGQSVKEEERFPAQTQLILQAVGKQVDRLTYIAATGWTTANLQEAIELQNPQAPFDIVTLLIGVNDQNQLHDSTGYRDKFTGVLQKAIALAGNKADHVFVLSIPDYSVTPLGAVDDTTLLRRRIDIFNSINLSVSNMYNISYTDITPVSKEALHDPLLIASDSLHFSGKMYRKWADLLVPEIRSVLK